MFRVMVVADRDRPGADPLQWPQKQSGHQPSDYCAQDSGDGGDRQQKQVVTGVPFNQRLQVLEDLELDLVVNTGGSHK